MKCFITSELMRWSMIEQIYGPILGQNPALSGGDEASKKRLKELHSRVVEHVRTRLIFLFMIRTTYGMVDENQSSNPNTLETLLL